MLSRKRINKPDLAVKASENTRTFMYTRKNPLSFMFDSVANAGCANLHTFDAAVIVEKKHRRQGRPGALHRRIGCYLSTMAKDKITWIRLPLALAADIAIEHRRRVVDGGPLVSYAGIIRALCTERLNALAAARKRSKTREGSK